MAVVIITEPEDTTPDFYDAVNEKLDESGGMPDGLLVHTAGLDDEGQFRVIDLWESVDAHNSFRDSRLMPAIETVARERGIEMSDGPPKQKIYEAHDVRVAEGAATR